MRADAIETVRKFYQSHRQELFTYALSLTRSAEAAEDAIHTVFWRLLRRRILPGELRPYVFRAVRNAAIDEIRNNHRTHCGEPLFEKETEGGRVLESSEQLEEFLARLSDDERECVVLKALNGLTLKEAAAVRGVSINTAASWYRRGLEKLRKAVEDGEPCGT
jgi:RNA polymerase sigma-70 factor (ECF subfamily)